MFRDCNSLEYLDISNFDTSCAIEFGEMFSGCSKITSLNLKSFNTTKGIS